MFHIKMYLRILFIILLIEVSTLNSQDTKPFVQTNVENLELHNVFSPESSSRFQTILLHKNSLLIGGKNAVFIQNSANVTQENNPSVQWLSDSNAINSCPGLPISNDGKKCYNLIQMIQAYNKTHYLICGTNAFMPENRFLVIKNGKSTLEDSNGYHKKLCSLDPDDKVSSHSVKIGHENLVFASAKQDLGRAMTLIKTTMNDMISSSEDSKYADSEYVASFDAMDEVSQHPAKKIYFISNEPTNGEVHKATVTQVCANDIGGQSIKSEKWTSMLKLEIACMTEDGLTFDVVMHSAVGQQETMYGVFTTRYTKYRRSAICNFRIVDIQKSFNKGKVHPPTMKSSNSGQNTVYTPGTCAYPGMNNKLNATSKDFPMYYLSYMDSHMILEGAVTPAYPPSKNPNERIAWKNPLLVKDKETFTKIAIQPITDLKGVNRDVLFVGTSNGKIYKFLPFKVVNREFKTLQLAEYQVSEDPILSLEIAKEDKYLYAGVNTGVHQISTSNCGVYTDETVCSFCDKCRLCVMARDPMCAWNTNNKMCGTFESGKGDSGEYLQDVVNGDADSLCGPLPNKTITMQLAIGTALFGEITPENVNVKWYKKIGESLQDLSVPELSKRYHVTHDKQLLIYGFNTTRDRGEYICDYFVNNIMVAKEITEVNMIGVKPPVATPTIQDDERNLTSVIGTNPVSSTFTNTDRSKPLDQNTTVVPLPTLPLPKAINEAALTGAIIALILLIIILLLFLWWRRCYRQQQCLLCFQGDKDNNQDIEFVDHSDSVPLKDQKADAKSGTNNSNNRDLEGENVVAASIVTSDGLYGGKRDSSTLSEEQSPLIPDTPPSGRKAKSVDDLCDESKISYIDEDSASKRKIGHVQSMRDIPRKKRTTPNRAQSTAFGDLAITFKGKPIRYSSLTRSKNGKWLIEIPDMPSTNGDEPDNGDFSFSAAPRVTQDSGFATDPHATLEHEINKIDSEIESSFLADENVPQRADKRRNDSLRSFNKHNSSDEVDSDCTIQASNLTLKPEDTPQMQRDPIVSDYNTKSMSKDRPHIHHHHTPSQGKKKTSMKKDGPNPPSINIRSVHDEDSDPAEHLHGQPKRSKNRPSPSSPAKSSHSLSSSSSNESQGSTVYKSARSSLNSDDPHLAESATTEI